MSQTLVQQTNSFIGNAAGSFTSATAIHDLLVCVAAAYLEASSSTAGVPVIGTPTTAGFTWTQAASFSSASAVNESGNWYTETVVMFYIGNAAVMSPSATTTVSMSNFSAQTNSYGVQLLEFSGASVLDVKAGQSGPPASYPIGAGTLTTAAVDIMVTLASDPNFNSQFSAAAGFTMTNMGGVGAFIGGCQYALNVAAGANNTAFGNGSFSGPWTSVGAAFKAASGFYGFPTALL